MSARTLMLTPWFSPHKIISWETAVCLIYLDKVEVVEEYDEEICSPSVSMRMPAVVRLKKAIGHIKRGVKFSRVNVFTRDGFRCQYCGEKKNVDELNYDHVIPRHHGGKTEWSNIVSACYACNAKKANRTPEQAGMMLLSRPVKPKSLPMTVPIIRPREVHPVWETWLGSAA